MIAKDYSEWIGKKQGNLTILGTESLPRKSDGKITLHLVCECECGNRYNADPYTITKGKIKSCGCMSKQRTRKKYHGMSSTRFYNIWCGILRRCNDKNSINYVNYGGRGIKVCDEWNEFVNFKKDMYSSYSKHVSEFGEKDTSIERIDNDRNYTKENCTWATKKEQNSNTRQVKLYDYQGEKIDLAEIARRENINYRTLRARIFQYGWTLDEAIERSQLKWVKKKAKLFDYYGEKLNLKQIAEKELISYSTLHDRVNNRKMSLEDAINFKR